MTRTVFQEKYTAGQGLILTLHEHRNRIGLWDLMNTYRLSRQCAITEYEECCSPFFWRGFAQLLILRFLMALLQHTEMKNSTGLVISGNASLRKQFLRSTIHSPTLAIRKVPGRLYPKRTCAEVYSYGRFARRQFRRVGIGDADAVWCRRRVVELHCRYSHSSEIVPWFRTRAPPTAPIYPLEFLFPSLLFPGSHTVPHLPQFTPLHEEEEGKAENEIFMHLSPQLPSSTAPAALR